MLQKGVDGNQPHIATNAPSSNDTIDCLAKKALAETAATNMLKPLRVQLRDCEKQLRSIPFY
jgi:hypothetical protein